VNKKLTEQSQIAESRAKSNTDLILGSPQYKAWLSNQ